MDSKLSVVIHAPDGSRVLCGVFSTSFTDPVAPSPSGGKLYGNLGFASVEIDYDAAPTAVSVAFDGTSSENGAALAALADECKTEGGVLSYHIHEMWGHTDYDAAVGAKFCGGAFTGGHLDPTYACGPASGNDKCGDADCNFLTPYNCSEERYMMDPTVCEIGDLSGKYGQLTLDGNGTASVMTTDQYLPLSSVLEGLSVVFHCPGGTRSFCMKLGTDMTVLDPARVAVPVLATSSASPSNPVSPSNSVLTSSPSPSIFSTPAPSFDCGNFLSCEDCVQQAVDAPSVPNAMDFPCMWCLPRGQLKSRCQAVPAFYQTMGIDLDAKAALNAYNGACEIDPPYLYPDNIGIKPVPSPGMCVFTFHSVQLLSRTKKKKKKNATLYTLQTIHENTRVGCGVYNVPFFIRFVFFGTTRS